MCNIEKVKIFFWFFRILKCVTKRECVTSKVRKDPRGNCICFLKFLIYFRFGKDCLKIKKSLYIGWSEKLYFISNLSTLTYPISKINYFLKTVRLKTFFVNFKKSLTYSRVRARQAKSVFLFKSLRMLVFVSSNAWKKFLL